MEISDLLLRKEEIPILYERNFQVPIHPNLLDPNISIDPNLASRVFPQTAEEWNADLQAYVETADLDEQTRNWYEEMFLLKKPEIETESGNQSILNGSWRDEKVLDPNGFARGLMINRDFGGSTFFNKESSGCRAFVPFREDNKGYIHFSEEKARAFGFEERDIGGNVGKGVLVHVYALHNVDNYHGALFLRNWSINYINAALESIL